MGLDFLKANGARRLRAYPSQPFLLDDGFALDDPDEEERLLYDIEVNADQWAPHSVLQASPARDWQWRPKRFVDGKDVGRTVAWLQSTDGFPVPVRLSEIGACVMHDDHGALRREFSAVERVVCLMADFFPWDEVEGFARALAAHNFRLLIASRPKGGATFDFEPMRASTQSRSNDEMVRLERQALCRMMAEPTIVDGRIENRAGQFANSAPIVGLIKTHSRNYLHHHGWRIFYKLEPGERTPAFQLNSRNVNVITWYLRLDGARGEIPNWGIVRLELAERFFNTDLGGDWNELDRLSNLVMQYRSRDSGYERASVSIHPIQRAEQSLGALFTEANTLIQRFYHLTGI